jgi:hypothetical protein
MIDTDQLRWAPANLVVLSGHPEAEPAATRFENVNVAFAADWLFIDGPEAGSWAFPSSRVLVVKLCDPGEE